MQTKPSDDAIVVFKAWEAELLRQAAFGGRAQETKAAEPAADADNASVFVDSVEDWEQRAINGQGPGARLSLADVKKDKAAMFRLDSKYKGMFFVDKDPDGETGWPEGAAARQEAWEERKIMGIVWMKRKGWGVETKIATNLMGEGEPYEINSALIQMIRCSDRNVRPMASKTAQEAAGAAPS